MKIVFMGSPDFAVPALQQLIESPHEIVGVYSQPPRPSGRGQKLKLTPVQKLAEENNLLTFTPEKLKGTSVDELSSLAPDLICVAAYGLILPKQVLDIAPCLNIHPSALPRWRGAAPMHRTVMAGDETTDICIMQMEEGLDSGPIYLRKPYEIGENETTGELHDRLAPEGGRLLLEVIDNWEKHKDSAVFQEGDVTYAHKFKPEDLKEIRRLDFSKSAEEVHHQICGLSPWPGALLTHKGEDIKVLASNLLPKNENSREIMRNFGEILKVSEESISIQCSHGIINCLKLQRSGKKAMNVSDFIRGYDIQMGDTVR